MAFLGNRALALGAGAVVLAGAAVWFAQERAGPADATRSNDASRPPAVAEASHTPPVCEGNERVACNPDTQFVPGFDGDVHPALDASALLTMKASWAGLDLQGPRGSPTDRFVGMKDQGAFELNPQELALLSHPRVAQTEATYSAHQLSLLLPTKLERVGQLWSIEPERFLPFLKQLHPHASVSFDGYPTSYGRRPGPAGAFGIVRTLSDDRAELQFRVHAELLLGPGIYYTPACFEGRLVLDRTQHHATWFQLAVPTKHSINVTVHLVTQHPRTGVPVATMRFERVPRMVVEGGTPDAAAEEHKPGSLSVLEASEQLKRQFYKFLDIDWVPITKAQEMAREQDRPLLVAVLTSPLDDQSC